MAYDSAREWLGADEAAAYWRLTEAYVDRMAALGGDAFRRTGSLRLAGDDEHDELRAEYEALREDGFDAEWRDGCRRRSPAGSRRALPPGGRRAAAGAARPAAGPGRGRRASRFASDRVTDLGALAAGTVLVATDGYPSGLLGELEGLIIPTRGRCSRPSR